MLPGQGEVSAPKNRCNSGSDSQMFSPHAVCREILHQGTHVTPLKLIKLAYISHGYHLGFLNRPLFNDEAKAWPYGPAVENIYHAVKHFKRRQINKELFDGPIDDDTNDDANSIIDLVVRAYDKYDGLQLSTITHRKGSPWHIAIEKYGQWETIPNRLIQEHYKSMIRSDGNPG